MDRVSGAAQDAVYGFNRIPCHTEHDERHGILLVQPILPADSSSGCDGRRALHITPRKALTLHGTGGVLRLSETPGDDAARL
jgi:hypothetical protein